MFNVAKAWCAKYVIEILLGVIVGLVGLAFGFYYKWQMAQADFNVSVEKAKTLVQVGEKLRNQRDEAIADNKNYVVLVNRQNDSIKRMEEDAAARKAEIARLQTAAKVVAKTHYVQAEAIKAIDTGGEACGAMERLVDAIKP